MRTNAPSGCGRQSPGVSREAVANSNQGIQVGTACDKGFGRSNPLPWTAGVRKHRSFADDLANGVIDRSPNYPRSSSYEIL
jgi:hypothetical protein